MMDARKLMEAIGGLDEGYIVEAEGYEATPRSKKAAGTKRVLLRTVAIAAAFLVCVLGGVSAMAAADVEPAYQLMYSISPSLAQQLKPIRRFCDSAGIRMEVVSADVSGDTATLLVSMKDMEGNRIDGTIDLFDSYSLNVPNDMYGHCSSVDFNEQTEAATFLIELGTMDGEPIEKQKVTFSANKFLSKKKTISGAEELDISAAKAAPDTHICQEGEALIPGAMLGGAGEEAAITGMGYVDGKLHIQTRYYNIYETDNHGFVYLVDADGKEVYEDDVIIFDDDEGNFRYYEFIFDIPKGQEDYTVYSKFITCDTLVKGDWQVTFSLE